jgi:hypothetical protein
MNSLRYPIPRYPPKERVVTKLPTIASVLALSVLVVSCSDRTTGPAIDGPQLDAKGPLTHQVTASGSDVCGDVPGCDANFSLVALQYADGSVSGQWQDTWGGRDGIPATPVHLTVTCLYVVGNQAWVGGVVEWPDLFAGIPTLARVKDNGPSGDEHSWLWQDFYGGCTTAPEFILLEPQTGGQVTVQ